MSGQALLTQIWNLPTNKKPIAVIELNGLKSISCQTDPVIILDSVPPPQRLIAERETPIKRPPPPAVQPKIASGPPSTQPEPNQVLIPGNPSTGKPEHGKIKDSDRERANAAVLEKPMITRRDSRKRDGSPLPTDAFPKPQKRRLMVKRPIPPSQDVADVRAGHRQSDGSFQQASLSRFVAPTGQQRPEFRTPLEGVPRIIAPTAAVTSTNQAPLPPLQRLPSANALQAPTQAYAPAAAVPRPARLQRSSCSTAIATDTLRAATSLIFGDDYTTPIPIRRRNTTAVDSSLHVPTYTPLCENPTGAAGQVVKGHRWSTPINPEGQDGRTNGGGKAVPTLPSLQAPRRKRDAGVNPEPSSPKMLPEKSEFVMPVIVRKRPRPNSCASESSEHHAFKRTRTTSLL